MTFSLIVRSPDGGIKRIPLDRDFFGVGRARNNELSYPDDSGLSRNHLAFERAGPDWTVRDLGSKNGTLINGQRLAGTHVLANADKVSAGHLIFEFSDGAGTAPVHETVVFVPGEEPTSKLTTATVVTTLEGAMSGKITTTAAGVTHAAAAPAIAADRQMKALIHAGRELSTHRPLNELFEVILGLAIEAVNATRGVLMTLEGGRLLVRAARGEGFRISGAVRDRVLKEAASLLVRDVQMDEAFKDRVSIVEQKVRSIIAVPLQTNDRVIGLIYVDSSNFIREFLPEDLNLLTVMANVAAIRIENARLAEVEAQEKALARELQQAAEIQRQLLPAKAPEVPGFEIAGYNAPCRTVGGDYYYFHTLADGRVSLLVADVAGKGMPAALLMSNLQAKVEVLVDAMPGAGALVTRLNQLIASSCPGNRFITLFFGIADPATGALVYCNAGHNPPALVRADGSTEWLKGGGLILGVIAKAKYEEFQVTMNRGDVLVLFSDGVTEAVPPGSDDEFGEDRLAALLHENHELPAESLIDSVKEAVAAWSAGAPPADDITLVVARRT